MASKKVVCREAPRYLHFSVFNVENAHDTSAFFLCIGQQSVDYNQEILRVYLHKTGLVGVYVLNER